MDARDVLGLSTARVPKLFKKEKERELSMKKKPDGIAREVYALMGDLPAVVPTMKPSGLKEKRQSNRPVHKWSRVAFKNSARKDALQLVHWQRSDYPEDYPFARYNKQIKTFEYTNEEYEQFIKELDASWSREETDHLMDLCKQFDLRFIVIQDRYDAKWIRTVEDLKDRYYAIAKKLLESRSEEDIAKHHLFKNPYNVEYERERKLQLERLFSRTKEQELEERTLLEEARKLDQRIRKEEKDVRNLQKLMKGSEVDETPTPKRKKATVIATPAATADEDAMSPSKRGKDRGSGPYLRSARLSAPLPITARQTKKVELVLEELGVGLKPMPTSAVVDMYERLRHEVVTMLTLQKAVTKKEQEKEMLLERRREMNRSKKGGGVTIGAGPSTPLEKPPLVPEKSPATTGTTVRISTKNLVSTPSAPSALTPTVKEEKKRADKRKSIPNAAAEATPSGKRQKKNLTPNS
eukprot:GILK01005792.1.p1 GENE.GILK01005792.1~~GILK01005792.1.p1  ORF type:complete len:478 (-),score=102.17 GILK01005792.1:141-1538(-)